VDGGNWYLNEPALTPYFGIWDRSAARLGKSVAFLPAHYPNSIQQEGHAITADHMSNVGALGYYIESIESLSQISTYFLQELIDFSNPRQVSDWLTRFKELDLRLVQYVISLSYMASIKD